VDDDCDGLADDADGSLDTSSAATWYADTDGDGYGDAGNSALACQQPSDHVADDNDCDDANASVNPEGSEVCNGGVDDDCDGLADDDDDSLDASDGSTWYADADEDGYGDASDWITACEQPGGYVEDSSDCDDGSATVNPGATETWYDGVDADCDGSSDYDADADSYASDSFGGEDCDDGDASINPDAYDIPEDGVDQDCDGTDASTDDGATFDTGSGTGGEAHKGGRGCSCGSPVSMRPFLAWIPMLVLTMGWRRRARKVPLR